MNLKVKGSITVFAALSMSGIIMILCIIIQSVAVCSGMHIADSSTLFSCKSVMGRYNREIFDNYHVFVLDTGYGKAQKNTEEIKECIDGYMSEEYSDKGDINLTGMGYDKVEDLHFTYITDDEGEYFVDQVVQYMKYKLGKEFVDKYLVKFGVITGNKSVVEASKEQAKLAEKSQRMSEDIMELYSCVDGFKVKGAQPVYDSDGDLIFNEEFLKAVVRDNNSKESMGYSDDNFYHVRKNKSFVLTKKMETLQTQLRRWIKAIDDNNGDRKKICKKKCKKICDELEESLDISVDCCDEALSIIKKVETDRKKYNEQKEAYDKYLDQHKDELGKDNYESFRIDMDEMSVPDNLDELKECIKVNKEKLLVMKDTLDFTLKDDKSSLNHSLAVAELIINYANDYSVEKICFDYNNLETECDKEGIMEGLLEIFEDGIISLVVDTNNLSKAKVSAGGLPSATVFSGGNSSVADMIEDALSSDISQLPGNVYYAVKSMLLELGNVEEILKRSTDEIIDRILLNEYIMECFTHYNVDDNNNDNDNLTHSLKYEAEYILAGNRTDMANIKAVVNRIIMFRTIMNYISILTDASKHYEAKGLAISAFGFTSMPVIVHVATCIIEILWAYEESLIDCNALLKGYKVPVAKNGLQIQLGISELLLLNKAMINKKAESYCTNKNYAPGMFDYETYLELFLLITPKKEKAYRCMDLIQININNTYGKNMRMSNGVYGISVRTKFKYNMLFIDKTWLKSKPDYDTGEREYTSISSFSY